MVTEKNNIPNMILIGSTSRNSGKTTLAIEIVNKYKFVKPIVALKVTTIEEKGGKCMHGEQGCGVCTNLKKDYDIVEELSKEKNKDTSLLLAAGAEKVYWLRTVKDSIYEGFQEFISKVPKDALIICESNSLRRVIKPGVFIMVKNSKNNQIKTSASEVIEKADIIIENDFDGDFQQIIRNIDNIKMFN